MKPYDIIIIGAGPAGMTAAIYAARYGMNTVIISEDVGGVMNEAEPVENWPGIKKINGFKLMQNFKAHVENLKVPIITSEITTVEKKGDTFVVKTKNEIYESKTIIIASGSKRRKLNVPSEKEFEGRGVHYCATCDAPLYKNKIVGVVGGSESAAQAALLLTKYAKKVYIIYRGDKLRAEQIYVDRILANKKIQMIYKSNVLKFSGKKLLENVELDTGKKMKLDGVFVEIGSMPSSALAEKLGVKLDDGKIVVNERKETNIKGVLAAGDVTNTPLRQCITACGDGAIAADSAYNCINKECVEI
ncbi:MAG: FAD-dependent oxidoreductase [Candidatus Aenigmatarchaeota archaeon]